MLLCSALVGETTTMRSSAITCMCLLILENRNNQVLLSIAVQLIPTVTMLLQEQSPDQTKAVLSYVKVCCAVLSKDVLEANLAQLVHASTTGLGDQKGKFASRCRGIMRKLFSRVDVETLSNVVPEQDLSLLEYISRQNRRTMRKREKRSVNVDKMLGSDSDSSDGEDSDDDAKSTFTMARPTASSNKRVEEDYRLQARPKAVRARDSMKMGSGMPSSLDDLLDDQPSSSYGHTVERKAAVRGNGRGEKRALEDTDKDKDEDEDYSVMVTKDGKVVIKEKVVAPVIVDKTPAPEEMVVNEPVHQVTHEETKESKKRKLNLKEPGEEYRSKKTGGDVWKKGMLEPHAYIPLDARLFSKKNHAQAVEHFGVVVKSGKKTQVEKTANWKGRHKMKRGKSN
jgi:ribosomal RNA-processing protein 12